MKRKATERSLAIALGVAMAVVSALTVVAFRTTDDFARSADWVAHTMEIRGALSDVLTGMEDGETGERGFVITGDTRFLEPFDAAVDTMGAHLARLQSLIADDATGQADFRALTASVKRTLDFQSAVVEARRSGRVDEAAALIKTGGGKERMEAVRSQITTMHEFQQGRLAQHLATLQDRHRALLAALAVFTLLTFGLVGAVFATVRRNTRVRSAERTFRGLVESAPDGMIIVNARGRITLSNARTEELFGYDPSELVGQPVEILVPEGVRARHPDLRAGYASSPRIRSMGRGLSLLGRRKDGSEIPVEISLSPVETEDGVLFCAIVRDVTERRRAEVALRETRALAESIVETIREPLVVLDAALRIQSANEAFRRRFGVVPESLVGRALSEIGDGQWNLPELQRRLGEVLANGEEVHDLEIEQEWPPLGLRTMRMSARPIHREGARTEQLLLAIEDVTDRKRAVQFLLEREALERTNRELQEFAYVASHDLQEPLRKIQAFGDRLAKTYAPGMPTEAADFVSRMQNAATRMRQLIDDLLAFSRVTTQAQVFAAVDLAAVAREVLTDLEIRIEQSGGTVELGELPTIEGDASQMRQLLQNLVANALKFHRPDLPPVVTIRARHLPPEARRDLRAPVPLYQIEVEDNGIGFEEKYLDRIFTIFQRLNGRNAFEGTGLGLAICRKIVERHRGQITARSVLGSGSTFIVTLPIRQPDDLGEEKVDERIDAERHAAHGG